MAGSEEPNRCSCAGHDADCGRLRLRDGRAIEPDPVQHRALEAVDLDAGKATCTPSSGQGGGDPELKLESIMFGAAHDVGARAQIHNGLYNSKDPDGSAARS